MRILAVGGSFNQKSGKSSGYFKKFTDCFYNDLSSNLSLDKYKHNNSEIINMNILNGGPFSDLERQLQKIQKIFYDIIIWFANVDNSENKLVREIKKISKKSMLITSKNNIENKYDYMDLASKALENKANLLVEFTKKDSIIFGSVIDPLCNCFIMKEQNINQITKVLVSRIIDLINFTRVSSESISTDNLEVPNIPDDYYKNLKTFANTFHSLIHANQTSRFLGNASFRCERGFPSIRFGNLIYVSKRNIDKREIDKNGFVAVDANSENKIRYYGVYPPSVDTPIQVRLYQFYKNINYMIHSHVYVKNCPFTNKVIPCGAIEEFFEISNMCPNQDSDSFAVNLKGHGSIILCGTYKDFERFEFIERPRPEIIYLSK